MLNLGTLRGFYFLVADPGLQANFLIMQTLFMIHAISVSSSVIGRQAFFHPFRQRPFHGISQGPSA